MPAKSKAQQRDEKPIKGLLKRKRLLLKPIKPIDQEQDEGETRGAPPRLHREEHGGPRVPMGLKATKRTIRIHPRATAEILRETEIVGPEEDISEMQRRSTRGSGPMTGAEITAGYRSLGKVNLLGDD